jgi:threonine/homoserine/homoserine lactone efflux protein
VLSFLVLGAGIGFVAGVSPGPVLTLVVAETLRGGWLRGAAVAAGPLLADGPIIVLALLVLAQLPPELERAISLAGGGFLLYLAASTILNSRQARLVGGEGLPARGGLLKGLLARALSPHPYLFWFLVGAPLLLQAGRDHPLAAPAFLVGYYSTIVGSNVALALALHRWVGLLSERLYRGLLLFGSAILGAYGLALLRRGVVGGH